MRRGESPRRIQRTGRKGSEMKFTKTTVAVGVAAIAVAAFFAHGASCASERKDTSARTEESSVTTNENGVVSHAYTECTVSTNGNMVTERRRETRTNMDADGNVLETSTSEFAQSYTVGDPGAATFQTTEDTGDATESGSADTASFLGVAFGEPFEDDDAEFATDPGEPAFLRATFTPKTPLEGFDDYYVYVTPKSHRVAKVCACAREAVDPGPRWRRHYLVEALEKRYGTWARPCSYRRPIFAFNIGPGRFASVCLAGASRDYETIVQAWDETVSSDAIHELEELRAAARKNATEKRRGRVDAAAAAF